MIIYQATKREFLRHVHHEDIEDVILRNYRSIAGGSVAAPQVRAWSQSLQHMGKVLVDDEIPADAGVAIEYQIPQSSKRIDFLITGFDEEGRPRVVIVELKQWSESRLSDKDGIIWARRGGNSGEREGPHPSYQAWSYAALLKNFNEAVYAGEIDPQPCAYLHNYRRDGIIDHPRYADHIRRAPLFLREERAKLQAFIRKHVRRGDNRELLYRIENGKIKPSKMLADAVVGLLQGKAEFVLIDDQKLVHESCIRLAAQASAGGAKQVVIVRGGPGTGKSVVAINLLGAALSQQLNARYVSRNAAPRAVYQAKLTGTFTQGQISNLFSGSGAFMKSEKNAFDVLIVDEAHRLNEKSGFYGNEGDHQVREIIRASRCTIFFVDDDQRVTFKDVGHSSELRSCARALGAEITELELASQFRCSGSDGYLAWLDDVLEIRPTANNLLDVGEYDFRVLDTPRELHSLIALKNGQNKARVVAGYCWPWNSRNDPAAWDIDIPEHGYRRRWNLDSDGSLWIVAENSVDEVGCIHTCQGLEVDYIGVIIAPDLVYRDGRIEVDVSKRAPADRTIRGLQTLRNRDPDRAQAVGDMIVRNTYRALMTRGMKGCFVYCMDAALRDHLRSRLKAAIVDAPARQAASVSASRATNVIPFRRVTPDERARGVPAAPLIDLRFAAGAFSSTQTINDPDSSEWVALPDWLAPQPGMFVAQVVGESMNLRIPNGSWCLFRANPQGTREGKIVVIQHREIEDPETGGSFTIKRYRSEKSTSADESWHHSRITLRPESSQAHFHDIVLNSNNAAELKVIAEFLMVLASDGLIQ